MNQAKILLVDDDPFALTILGLQLANLGLVDSVACERAEDALGILRNTEHGFELLICDLQMPEMDGVELVRHVSRTGYTGAVVFVTGEDQRIRDTAVKLARAYKLDVLGALQKPVSPELLRELLESRPAGAPRTGPPRRSYTPTELADAISGGQLVNFYQPKVDVLSGVLVGAESLVRWRHPTDGLVFPDSFVGLAEDNDLIDDLTRVVLVGALRAVRAWHDAGLGIHVAVNISMHNLASLEFPDFVARAAHDAGVPLSALVLEVTESRLMNDARAPLEILTRLRLKRISLAMDDFGTGHSSLAQLRDFPFDEMKIDRGFIHGAGRDASLRAIVEASCAMARQLGMKIVAEGVEDQADWDFLHTSGCDYAQGYFIARPMPAADLVPWLAAWEARRRDDSFVGG